MRFFTAEAVAQYHRYPNYEAWETRVSNYLRSLTNLPPVIDALNQRACLHRARLNSLRVINYDAEVDLHLFFSRSVKDNLKLHFEMAGDMETQPASYWPFVRVVGETFWLYEEWSKREELGPHPIWECRFLLSNGNAICLPFYSLTCEWY